MRHTRLDIIVRRQHRTLAFDILCLMATATAAVGAIATATALGL